MTIAELMQQRDICVYAVLYIKHVRHGYSKSFYSFLNRNYHPTVKDSRDAMKFDKFLRQKNLIIRTNRTYSWNTQQKTILVNEVVNFFN